ncbi:hypothetical protein JHJ32_21955 [Parapedobacter sp. ISTM3]|uniref:hypothetical protein n=1 Tax=Parapedobacter sp. ISTM3 TaxID=2800130 RepID=UPI0019072421|nr:hypothetical protein [Parapedobacter sp. ISTM3]MBK1442680.1 hypothetical protein [Parapedobacter sp. ISTM3]
MRLNCIIDTCSCIYLSNAEFQQKNLLKHLIEITNLNYSHEVHKEILDHVDKGLPKFIQDPKLRVRPRKWNVSEYQRRILGKTLASRKRRGNRGEVDNFIVSLDLLHHIKKGAIVFITDDKKAMNGTIGQWFSAFPGLQHWSSYDVILYLYAMKVIPSKDIAIELVRDLNAITKIEEGSSEEMTVALQKQLKEINDKLEKIGRLYN